MCQESLCGNTNLKNKNNTVLYWTGDLQRSTMNLQLLDFRIWCDRNQLTMNIKKTKYVIF